MAGAPIPNADCTDCPELTTSVATVGLCLADTTPIAVVVTRDCNGVVTEDGWIDLTSGTFTAGSPPPGTGACSGDTYDFALSGWLCDILPDGSVAGIALVQIERDASGAVIGITLIGVNGLPYVPVGVMTRCPEDRLAAEVLCDAGAANVPFVRFYTYSPVGTIPVRDTDLDGTPYVVIGPAARCPDSCYQTNILELCDQHPPPDAGDGLLVLFLRIVVTDCLGLLIFVADLELDGSTPYTVIGTVARCTQVTGPDGGPVLVELTNQFDDELEILCDNNGPFLRRYLRSSGTVITTADTLFDGVTPYVTVGTVVRCNPAVSLSDQFDDEYVVLCDTVTTFIRRFRTNLAGAVTITNLTLAGGAYVPVGAVASCVGSTTITGTVTVAPLASQNVRTYRNNLVGVGVWSIAANGHGGKVKSITFRRRAGGIAASVTITDNFGTVTSLLAGESETWSITALDDEIISPFLVTTTDAANNIIINWTEAP